MGAALWKLLIAAVFLFLLLAGQIPSRGGGGAEQDARFLKRAPFIQDDSKHRSLGSDQDVEGRNVKRQQQDRGVAGSGDGGAGVTGPVGLLTAEELELLPKIARDWQALKIQMHRHLLDGGFQGPAERDCFLWLEDCYNLAKQEGVLEAARRVLGDRVLVYGVTVWNAPPRSDQPLELKFDGYQCPTVDVLVNSGLRFVQNSHKLPQAMALKLAKEMSMVAASSTGEDVHQRIESVVLSSLSRILPGAHQVREVNAGPGEAYIVQGRMLYAPSNPIDDGRTSLLVQFASSDCKLRDQQPDARYTTLLSRPVMPPTLLVNETKSFSEVRQTVLFEQSEDIAGVESNGSSSAGVSLLATVPDTGITFFRRKAQMKPRFGSARSKQQQQQQQQQQEVYGSARSRLLKSITIVRTASEFSEPAGVSKLRKHSENQLVLVLEGSVTHRQAMNDYREVRELRAGEMAFLPKAALHALSPQAMTELLSIRWTARQDDKDPAELQQTATATATTRRKSLADGTKLFEMPAADLGAINAVTVVLRGGQAYDPDKEAQDECDVLVAVLRSSGGVAGGGGRGLQVLPLTQPEGELPLQQGEAVLVTGGTGCVLWNAGLMPVTLVAVQLCRALNKPVAGDRDAYLVEASFRSSGRVL